MASSQPPGYVEFPDEVEQVLFTDPNHKVSTLTECPTVGTCITHLKLLEVFHRLREEVSSEDGLFGLSEPSTLPSSLNEKNKALGPRDEAVRKATREKRWSVYVARAVERFEVWWTRVVPQSNGGKLVGRLTMKQMAQKEQFELLPMMARPLVFTPDLLPPLDVLMVWYSYVLAPRDFLEDCLRYSKMDFWATGIPFEVIRSCLDTSGSYQVGVDAMQLFESRTGHSWDNGTDSLIKTLQCPKDNHKFMCLWTTYAESDFREACSDCSMVLTHDVLSVHQLRRDADDLMLSAHPMRGTILPSDGIPHSPASLSRYPPTFPNRFIQQGGFMTRIATMAHSELEPRMEDVRDWMQGEIERGDAVKRANNRMFSSKLGTEEEASLGRMLNCYWDNHSSFSIDLGAAVLRHGDFVKGMFEVGWLNKEGLNGRLWRGLQRCDRVFQILAKNPQKEVVPMLDVQLAWYTSLLSPKDYFAYSVKLTKRLIDDFEGNGQGGGLEWTEKMYLKLFGEEYVDDETQLCIMGVGQEKERRIAGVGHWGSSAGFSVG